MRTGDQLPGHGLVDVCVGKVAGLHVSRAWDLTRGMEGGSRRRRDKIGASMPAGEALGNDGRGGHKICQAFRATDMGR